MFRLDRVRSVTTLESTFEPPARSPELTVYGPRPDGPRVTLALEPSARWVAEQYPVEGVEELEGGRLRVTMAASEQPWLERLLLRLGSGARVVEGPGDVAAAARRLLGRYGEGSGSLGTT